MIILIHYVYCYVIVSGSYSAIIVILPNIIYTTEEKNINDHEILKIQSHFEKRQKIVYIHDSKLTTKHYIAVNQQE